MKYFNTTGPCLPDLHYMIPPGPRLPQARKLIDEGRYFVVHAPRQTGKTTSLQQLARSITAEGGHLAVYFSCEEVLAGDDFGAAEEMVLSAIRTECENNGYEPALLPPDLRHEDPPGSRLRKALSAWARQCPYPLVLFFDEIDVMQGVSLISVLRQLRAGHNSRGSAPFPHSVVLCGLRDVRDYKAASGGDPTRLGTSSPFNIKAESLRLTDFTFEQVAELYNQHTDATGQVFTSQALQRAFEASQGQPWLVNALPREVITKMQIEPPEAITDEHMEEAIELLIVTRATHLDSLVARLHEPRVERVLEPMIAGTDEDADATYDDDLAYVRDLGLVTQSYPVQVANPIYQEVILRVLAQRAERRAMEVTRSFVNAEGRLDFTSLLEEFAAFWVRNAEILTAREGYNEAACQMGFMGYLHRVINGGGCIDREFATGTGRIDIMVRWPYTNSEGERTWQWEAAELKVRHPGRPDPLPTGLTQLDGYLDRLGLDTGTLIVFDRRPDAPPLPERTDLDSARTPGGRDIRLLRA